MKRFNVIYFMAGIMIIQYYNRPVKIKMNDD